MFCSWVCSVDAQRRLGPPYLKAETLNGVLKGMLKSVVDMGKTEEAFGSFFVSEGVKKTCRGIMSSAITTNRVRSTYLFFWGAGGKRG